MAGAAEHRMWGVAAGAVATALMMPKNDFLGGAVELIGAGLGGRIGGAAADALEPAVSPRHRKVAHSGIAVAGLITFYKANHAAKCREQAAQCLARANVALTETDRNSLQMQALAWRFFAGLILGFIAGYGSHLVLDSQTPAGLPLLGLS